MLWSRHEAEAETVQGRGRPEAYGGRRPASGLPRRQIITPRGVVWFKTRVWFCPIWLMGRPGLTRVAGAAQAKASGWRRGGEEARRGVAAAKAQRQGAAAEDVTAIRSTRCRPERPRRRRTEGEERSKSLE